ncbi:MAG: hypothetical protein COA79_07835 [Planctomycetota bacterium]|nr:MAG: hypothetical protein COA79_07835 [Planctomycetota bacterium]
MSENSYLTQDQEFSTLGNYSLKVTSPILPPLYSTNEVVYFIIELKENNQIISTGNISYELLWDQQETIERGDIQLNGQLIKLPFTAKKPGFVVVEITYKMGEQVLQKSCGAGFSVDELRPSMEEPNDFHGFWDTQKDKLSKIPIKSSSQEINFTSHPHLHEYTQKSLLKEDISKVDLSYVSVTCLGKPTEGVLTMPKDRSEGKHPLVLALHGAGVGPSQPHNFISHAEKGAIIFEINAHGIPNDQPEQYYLDLAENELNNYSRNDFKTPEEFYFLGMFIRVKRGLDFLKSLPEWDGKRLFIRGSSQGGAQSIAGAYLDQDVTGFISLVSGFCDHSAALINRAPGWPSLVPYESGMKPDQNKIEILRYFDSVNFLRNSKAEGLFTIGYLDGTCKPTSIYTAYNIHNAPHKMMHQPYSAHTILDDTQNAANQFMWDHFKKLK